MMNQTFQLIIGFSYLAIVQGGQLCGLCGSLSQMPTRWDHVVSTSPFKTCRHIYFDMASMPTNDPQCHPMQRKYQDICCDGQSSSDRAVSAPAQSTETGNEPYCRICRNDDFPAYPNKMISARYVGTYSCASLYERGRNGLIPRFMCGPLQAEARDICGCGQPEDAGASQSNLAQTPPPPPQIQHQPQRPAPPSPTPPAPANGASCSDSRGWTDSNGYNCQAYADTEASGVPICDYHKGIPGAGGLTPVQACCACKYVTGQASNPIPTPFSCSDSSGWTDPNGYNCRAYADTEASGVHICDYHKNIRGAGGLTCVQACCACQ